MPTVREALLRMDEAVPGASDDDVRKAFLQEYGVDLNGVGEEQLDCIAPSPKVDTARRELT